MNIGTLFAFVVVAIGVIILRRTRPDLHRAFRTPLVPFVPIVSVARLAVADAQPARRDLAAVRRSGWCIGFVVYFLYGRSHSRLGRGEEATGAATVKPQGGDTQ